MGRPGGALQPSVVTGWWPVGQRLHGGSSLHMGQWRSSLHEDVLASHHYETAQCCKGRRFAELAGVRTLCCAACGGLMLPPRSGDGLVPMAEEHDRYRRGI